MTRHENGKEPPAQTTPPTKATQDLSGEIVNAVVKEASDLVRCVRIFGDYYRCNWWAPAPRADESPATAFDIVATHRVRKSRLLLATAPAGELVIREMQS